jgi:hypothetical protein
VMSASRLESHDLPWIEHGRSNRRLRGPIFLHPKIPHSA